MKNFHVKNILLGIGIGIILTSIISMIFMAGRQTEISNDEIVRRAKAMGMVDGTDILFSDNNPAGSPSPAIAESKPTNAPNEQVMTSEQQVKVIVNKGDTSEIIAKRLLSLGLIGDKSAFINELNNLGLETKIDVGEVSIKKGADIKSIIKAITNQN